MILYQTTFDLDVKKTKKKKRKHLDDVVLAAL